MKHLHTLILLVMCQLAVQAANIPSGTKLYLDVSRAWTEYDYFSAYFRSDGSDGNFVRMNAVENENRVWEVTAPGSNKLWSYVVFRGHYSQPPATGDGEGTSDIQTQELTWSGTDVLYRINCNNCIYNAETGTYGSAGAWTTYLALPSEKPWEMGVSAEDQVRCDTVAGTMEMLTFGTGEDFVNFQWLRYNRTTSEWERISKSDLSISVMLPTSPEEDAYYYFVGQRLYDNRLTNGDFQQGNTGFSSGYSYNATSLWDEGVYTICTDVSTVHGLAPTCYDHTSGDGTGKMLAVNGDPVVGKTVWEQTVHDMQPNTDYVFSAWVTNWDNANSNLAALEFSINGTLQGGQFVPVGGHGHWTQLYTIWNSGSSTSATIKLVNQQGAVFGNDFAVDDIVFARTEKFSRLVRYSFRDCSLPETPCVSDLVYAKWTNFLFCDNGRDEFTAFQWYRDNMPIEGETKQYLYREEGLGESEYIVVATREDGSKEHSCPMTFADTPKSAETYGDAQAVRKPVIIHLGNLQLTIVFDEQGNAFKSIRLP